MKSMHWISLLIGYVLGSFFGVSTVLGLLSGLGGKKTAAPAMGG